MTRPHDVRAALRSIRQLALIALSALAVHATPASADESSAYRKAAEAVVAGINKGSGDAFNAALDKEAILDAALAFSLDELVDKSGLRTGLGRGIDKIGKQIVSLIPEGGYAKLLRIKPERGQAWGLVRLDYGDQGYGYMDLLMRPRPGGGVRIVDWFDFATGQRYSASLSQLAALLAPTPTSFGRLFDVASGRADSTRQLTVMFQAMAKQEFKKASETFEAMDDDLKRNRAVSVVAVNAANRSQDANHYRSALANLDRHYGRDPAMVFLLLDYYFLTKQYDKTQGAIDAFEKYVGVEDAALLGIRANTYLMSDNPDRAIAMATKGIKIEPALNNNYWSLLAAYNRTGRYDKVIEVTGLLHRQFGYNMTPAMFEKDPDYREFVQSPAFRRWRQGS